jgi:hyperosmotically inducible protein
MPNPFVPLFTAALVATAMLAACERPGSRANNLAMSDVTARSAPGRGAPDAFPATTPPAQDAPQALPPAALSSDVLSDSAINGKIKASIQGDPGMAGADVSVHTDRGVVNLTGTVKSQEQTAIASAHAQRQDGVMRIDNHLAMPPQ